MSGARWAAVLLGFAGVLLVVNPFDAGGLSDVSSAKLLMLATAPVFAGSFLVAKVLTRHERSDVMVLWQHLLVSLLLLPLALIWWALPSSAQWMLLVLCGFLGATAHYCMTRAFKLADISAVQPVKFLELIWAAILGLAMFGDLPGVATLVGGAVIIASTLWLARYESRGI